MREHSILYDRDEHGEYLHFYTEMLGSRVFFEVVQRIGGYAGYGARVRRCAWRRTGAPPDHAAGHPDGATISGTTTRWPT